MEWVGILKSSKANHKQKEWAYRKLKRLINIVKHTDAMKIAFDITNFAEDLIKYSEKYPEYFEDIKHKITEIKKYMVKVEEVKRIKKELEKLKQYDPLCLLDEILYDNIKNLIEYTEATIYNFGIKLLSNDNILISATKQEVTIPIYLFKIIRIMEKINPTIAIIASDDYINNFLRKFNLEVAIERYAKEKTTLQVTMDVKISHWNLRDGYIKITIPENIYDEYERTYKSKIKELMKTYRLLFNKLLEIITKKSYLNENK